MLIQIKNAKKRWITVELLSVNKGGTITIKYKGNIIKRKAVKIRWEVVETIPKAQGFTSNSSSKDKRFKTKRRRNKFKKRSTHNKKKRTSQGTGKKRRVTYIAGHKVNFL